MSAQLRSVSRLTGVAALGLMALLSGTRAHAQSMAITNFTTSGNPGGYYDVTDNVNLTVTFSNIPSQGACGYTIYANTYYYSGPYASGTLLQSVNRSIIGGGQGLPPGNSTLSANLYLNTPSILRASEPAGTQSILYYYTVNAGGGCNGWSGDSIAGGPWISTYVVHG